MSISALSWRGTTLSRTRRRDTARCAWPAAPISCPALYRLTVSSMKVRTINYIEQLFKKFSNPEKTTTTTPAADCGEGVCLFFHLIYFYLFIFFCRAHLSHGDVIVRHCHRCRGKTGVIYFCCWDHSFFPQSVSQPRCCLAPPHKNILRVVMFPLYPLVSGPRRVPVLNSFPKMLKLRKKDKVRRSRSCWFLLNFSIYAGFFHIEVQNIFGSFLWIVQGGFEML